ncbi:MAG: hypothetical protein GVY17_10835 [Cyanobacteria bacterium]|jgi:hypothetical protein|nr:hypothetical protein [Cyanobacteria bacterium GSL.Bin21]
MTNYNIALQGTQLQGSQNKTTSQVLDFNFIKALPTENEIVMALLELDFKKRNKVEAAAKIVRRILIDQHKIQTLSGKEVGIEREGKKYIFNTYPELAEYCELRHLSRDQMGRIVRALEDTELLESIQPFAHYWGEYTPRTFRENPNNHTKAYRINLELLNEYLDLTAEPQSTNIGRHRSYTNCTHECATFAQSLKETNNQPNYSIKEREQSKNIYLEKEKRQSREFITKLKFLICGNRRMFIRLQPSKSCPILKFRINWMMTKKLPRKMWFFLMFPNG